LWWLVIIDRDKLNGREKRHAGIGVGHYPFPSRATKRKGSMTDNYSIIKSKGGRKPVVLRDDEGLVWVKYMYDHYLLQITVFFFISNRGKIP